jgi:regulator of protease activity HflC (stomatin/prohibitin superfamily)
MARYLKVSGVLFVQVTDAANATYGIRQPLISVVKAAEAGMRNALGDMEMDECFREKDKLNKAVMQTLVETTGAWGLEAKRYEVTDIDAAAEIKAAMNLQAAAERQRREAALGADAEAEVMQKLAKAQKHKDTDESLGIKARSINEAEGQAEAIRTRADADRHRIVQEASAMAEANEKIAQVLSQPGGEQALRFTLAMRYVDMFRDVAGKSNTMFMGQDMGDLPKVLAKGYAALDSLGAAGVLKSPG